MIHSKYNVVFQQTPRIRLTEVPTKVFIPDTPDYVQIRSSEKVTNGAFFCLTNEDFERLQNFFFRKITMAIPRSVRLVKTEVFERHFATMDQQAIEVDLTQDVYADMEDDYVVVDACINFEPIVEETNSPSPVPTNTPSSYEDYVGVHPCHVVEYATGGGKCQYMVSTHKNVEGRLKREPLVFWASKSDIKIGDDLDDQKQIYQSTLPVLRKLEEWFEDDGITGYDGYFLIPMLNTDQSIEYLCIPNVDNYSLAYYKNIRTGENIVAQHGVKAMLKKWIDTIRSANPNEVLVKSEIPINRPEILPVDQWSVNLWKYADIEGPARVTI